jgi:thioredoxin reductase
VSLVADIALHETIIIGGGPAGLSAALVLGRCMRRVLLCDSGGYRNERSAALHCFLSRDGVPPSRLLQEARRQLQRYKTVSVHATKVTGIERRPDRFVLATGDGRELEAKTLLVATGVVDELPPLEGIEPLFGRSVHVCPYCDGWEHRNAPIAAYGRGEKGAGLALLVRQWTDDVTLCSDGPAGLSDLQHRQLQARGIAVREQPILKLHGEEGCLRAIEFRDGSRLPRHALFFSTGQHPRSPLLEHLGCAFDDDGGVRCADTGETSIPDVFVAGDVSRDVQLAIIAAAEGARAALAINRRLLEAEGCL